MTTRKTGGVQPTLFNLEPVSFHRPGKSEVKDRYHRLAVDFGTSATVVLAWHETEKRGDIDYRYLTHQHQLKGAFTPSRVGRFGKDSRGVGPEEGTAPEEVTLKRFLQQLDTPLVEEHLIAAAVQRLSDYLVTLLDKGERESEAAWRGLQLGPDPDVVVSVPNTANAVYVYVVRTAVANAFERKFRVSLLPKEVRIIREGEAVAAYFSSERELQFCYPKDLKEWLAISNSKGWNMLPESYRLLVLDFGGGTIDATLANVQWSENLPHIDLLMNAGLPIGGIDVVRLMVDAAVPSSSKRGVLRHQADRVAVFEEAELLMHGGLPDGWASRICSRLQTPAEATADEIFDAGLHRFLAVGVDGLLSRIASCEAFLRHGGSPPAELPMCVVLSGRFAQFQPVEKAVIVAVAKHWKDATVFKLCGRTSSGWLPEPETNKEQVALGCSYLPRDRDFGVSNATTAAGISLKTQTGFHSTAPAMVVDPLHDGLWEYSAAAGDSVTCSHWLTDLGTHGHRGADQFAPVIGKLDRKGALVWRARRGVFSGAHGRRTTLGTEDWLTELGRNFPDEI